MLAGNSVLRYAWSKACVESELEKSPRATVRRALPKHRETEFCPRDNREIMKDDKQGRDKLNLHLWKDSLLNVWWDNILRC